MNHQEAKAQAIQYITESESINVAEIERLLQDDPDYQLSTAEINALLGNDPEYNAWLRSVEMSNEELDAWITEQERLGYFDVTTLYNKETDDINYLLSL